MTKPKTVKQWEKICTALHESLASSIRDEEMLLVQIDNLEEKVGKLERKLEEQLLMSEGVIKYLEAKIVRPDPV
jgi:uncharacterized protein Yka (UPF0111/DUF47 family)